MAAIPAQDFSGSIIALWSRSLGFLTPVVATLMSLNLVISSKEAPWILFIIYNSQILTTQKLLCNTLTDITTTRLPWLLARDFNAVLSDQDFKGGSSRSYTYKSNFFTNLINSNNLVDVGFVGPCFTWCNNQTSLACRWNRLDRFLANHEWVSIFTSIVNQHLLRACSNHTPPLLTAHFCMSSKNYVFRFDNFWFEYHSCHINIVKAFDYVISSSPIHFFHHCIARVKHNLISWRTVGIRPIDNEISIMESKIKAIKEREVLSPDLWHQL